MVVPTVDVIETVSGREDAPSQSEFGHTSYVGKGFCIDSWGAGPFIISFEDKPWRFEDSDRFGPTVLKKNGDYHAATLPSERSPFWKAHRAWVSQGRKLADDGQTCIYEPNWTKPTIVEKRGRDWFVVEQGDEDGPIIRRQAASKPAAQTEDGKSREEPLPSSTQAGDGR